MKQVWYDSELLFLLLLAALLCLAIREVGKGFTSLQPFIKRYPVTLFLIPVLSVAFFPVMGLIAQFFDRLPLAAAAYELSPRRPFLKEARERAIYEAASQTELRKNYHDVKVGSLLFRVPLKFAYMQVEVEPDSQENFQQKKSWQFEAKRAVDRLAQLLPGSPPLPVIEMRELYDSHGCFNNPFTLAINSDEDEQLRTVVHELTHLHLLWALIPGLPVDCPRWLNEGLAEHISGEAMQDSEGWAKNAMVRERDLVDLCVVSPAFSWSGRSMEWQARDATAMLLERHGEKIFLDLINGLRLARPFYSVYSIVTGQSLESFAAEWKKQFSRERVLENQLPADIDARLTWLAQNRGYLELQPLLKNLPERYLPKSKQNQLISLSRVFEAGKCRAKGKLLEELGWMRGVDTNLPGNENLRGSVNRAKKSLFAVDPLMAGNKSGRELEALAWKPSGTYRFFAWLFALGCSAVIMAAYTFLREVLVSRSISCWQSKSVGIAFRWLVVGLTGLAGGWFLRFLVISMIPYGGLFAMTDFYRIILAETLVIILWLGLAWQLKLWTLLDTAPENCSPDSATRPSLAISTILSVFLAVGILPPLLTAYQSGWRPMNFGLQQVLPVALLFIASSVAFGVAVWTAARNWQGGIGGTLAPAIVYALFRGGLAADPYGSLFALVAGWRLVELTRSSQQIWPAIVGDMLLCGPAFLLSTGWFPAFDPVVGYWYGGGGAVPWWLAASFILFLLRAVWQPRVRREC